MSEKLPPPPEVQAFIDEIAAVCAKHSMAIHASDDQGLYITYDQYQKEYGMGYKNTPVIWSITPEGLQL